MLLVVVPPLALIEALADEAAAAVAFFVDDKAVAAAGGRVEDCVFECDTPVLCASSNKFGRENPLLLVGLFLPQPPDIDVPPIPDTDVGTLPVPRLPKEKSEDRPGTV